MFNGESTYLNDESAAKGYSSLAALRVGMLVSIGVFVPGTPKSRDSIT